MALTLDARIPDGPIEKKWDKHRFDLKLVNPANKRKYDVLIVGTGLAGGSAAAALGELEIGADGLAGRGGGNGDRGGVRRGGSGIGPGRRAGCGGSDDLNGKRGKGVGGHRDDTGSRGVRSRERAARRPVPYGLFV